MQYTGCDPAKIVVTYEAADATYHRIDDPDRLRQAKDKYDLPDRFLLYTGSLSPRKNLVRLLQAFAQVCARVPHALVLTGSKSWKDRSVYAMMDTLKLRNRICQLGYVEPADMPALYTLADAYAYPSLYEGFGLPVLEAMQCGCPVVASNASSIPEVAGDAAILVDPCDVGAITDALHTILTDQQAREKLIAAGLHRATQFSWRRCAETILSVVRAGRTSGASVVGGCA